MRISESRIRQIIREEAARVLREAPRTPRAVRAGRNQSPQLSDRYVVPLKAEFAGEEMDWADVSGTLIDTVMDMTVNNTDLGPDDGGLVGGGLPQDGIALTKLVNAAAVQLGWTDIAPAFYSDVADELADIAAESY